jgi:predicted nucleotidyltransferase
MVDKTLGELIAAYSAALEERGVRVERIILFGSHTAGTARPDSDLDLAVISPDFGRDRFEESKILFQAAWRIDPRIEPVPIPSGALERDTWQPLLHEISTKGLVLYPA